MEDNLTEIPADVGVCEVNEVGEIIRLERECYGQGMVFKSWDAFYNRPDAPCYVPELSDDAWTGKDILGLCNGQKDFAHMIFKRVGWQSPATVLDEFLCEGEWYKCPKCGSLVDCEGEKYPHSKKRQREEKHTEKTEYQARKILRRLHEAGGCGAEEESWADGWDTAIDEAISIVEDVTGISVTEVLD